MECFRYYFKKFDFKSVERSNRFIVFFSGIKSLKIYVFFMLIAFYLQNHYSLTANFVRSNIFFMKILIIGFGHLGKCLSARFLEKGWEVIVLDIDPEKLSCDPGSSNISFLVGDATKKYVLEKIDFDHISEVYVCIRKNEAANLLSSLLLKDMGVSNVTSTYFSDLQAKALSYKGITILDTAAETANVIAH